MSKPERILLQEKAWRKHATLANGVKCGEDAAFSVGMADTGSRGIITGWKPYFSLSGQLMEGQWPSAGGGDSDEIFRVDNIEHKRILGVTTNSVMPDLVRAVLDVGEDPDQPGQRECESALLGTDELDDRLIDLLVWEGMLPEDYVKPEGPVI